MDQRVNSYLERNIWSMAEETSDTATFLRDRSQSQPPQMQSSQFHQPESSHHRVNGLSNGDLDLQTLESSFSSLDLSFSQSILHHNRYNQVINGAGAGGYMFPPTSSYHQSCLEEFQRFNHEMRQRLLVQNDCVNRSYGYDTNGGMLNNGFLNGVSYSSRNRVSDQNPWDYSNGVGTVMNNSRRGSEGFGYTHDQGLSMENRRGSSMGLNLRQQVLKRILEGSKPTVDRLFDGLIDHICHLMMDPLGNDVVKALMTKCSSEQISQIVDKVTQYESRFVNICFHRLGSLAIQSLLGQMSLRPEIMLPLINEIITYALGLCFNSYGNYVVQYVIELDDQHVREKLVKQLLGSYANLACNKYGSHVVQKLLKLRGIDSTLIVNDLLREINTLLIDPFGNYVIQTAWLVSEVDLRYKLKCHIVSNIRLMRCNKFGKKILEKLNL